MVEASTVVRHEVGLHARPAAVFVRAAAGFESEIAIANVTRGTKAINAKSIVAVFKIAVAKDHEIRLAADGPDEQEALDTLLNLVNTNFGE